MNMSVTVETFVPLLNQTIPVHTTPSCLQNYLNIIHPMVVKVLVLDHFE
jgi:hypothetical protein